MSDPTLPAIPPPDAPREPLLTVATITAAATAVLALLVAFGIHLEPERVAAILGVVAVLAPLVVAAVARGKVWSPASVAKVVAEARMSGDGPRELR